MRGDNAIIQGLNAILRSELTAINQYFLHSRMLGDWGLDGLSKKAYDASIDEMKYADKLIQRILLLEGLPNLQDLAKLRIGEDPKEILQCDLAMSEDLLSLVRKTMGLCEKTRDYTTRAMLGVVLDAEEEYLDWLGTQIALFEKLGEQNYLQSMM